MGFAGSGAADEDRIAFGVEESAGGEFVSMARGISPIMAK
jgi:hypothetical protein